MAPTPRISVLLPTRASGPILADAVRSVLSQEHPGIELVVSDNANDDETPEVLAGFDDPRLRVIRQEQLLSMPDNWAAALDASRGEYVLLIGDDDALLQGSLQRLDELARAHGDPDCLSHNGYHFAPAGSAPGLNESRYRELRFEPDFELPGGEFLPGDRVDVVRDFFGFEYRFPLGFMQLVMFSRAAARRLPGGTFAAPVPDLYAVAALLVTAERWVHVRDHLVAVGISKHSFANHYHRDQRGDAMAYLGDSGEFAGSLPGNPLMDGLYRWLLQLRSDFPEEFGLTHVDRPQYVARQLWASFRQRSKGSISRRELRRRLGMLSTRDWLDALRAAARPRHLRYAVSALPHRRRLEQYMLRREMDRPHEARTLSEFTASMGSG